MKRQNPSVVCEYDGYCDEINKNPHNDGAALSILFRNSQ